MLLFNMRNKYVINYSTGERIGSLSSCDLKIDENTGQIQSLLLPKSRFAALFSHEEADYTEIPWCRIKKVGVDTIIVDL